MTISKESKKLLLFYIKFYRDGGNEKSQNFIPVRLTRIYLDIFIVANVLKIYQAADGAKYVS